MSSETTKVAAIFGVTGLVGKELARILLSSRNWKVFGVARRPDDTRAVEPRYRFVSCDLLSPSETQEKLSSFEDVTHIFWVTWATEFQLDSPECCKQNKEMMANVLNVILPKAKRLRHVSLQTGTKHYVSLDGSSGQEVGHLYEEESPRAAGGNNFYYALEDLLLERLPSYQVAWSIHRPGLILGRSRRTLYNFIGSICVYGTICKHLNLPFVFGGIKECWEEMYVDVSDARLVAEQHDWASTSTYDQPVQGEAFNAINGEGYSWKEIWPAIGAKLGVVMKNCIVSSEDFGFSEAMGDKGDVWKEIVVKNGLVESEMKDLANWDFLDTLFRCPVKMLCTRKKVDLLGFKTRYHVLDSMFYWIDVMKADKIIP